MLLTHMALIRESQVRRQHALRRSKYRLCDTAANCALQEQPWDMSRCHNCFHKGMPAQQKRLCHTCMNVTMPSRPLICANTCLQDTILQQQTAQEQQQQQQQQTWLYAVY